MKKYISILLIVALCFTGCDKDLDLNPKDQVSDASFWKTPADFELAANDFYFSLLEAYQYIDRNSDIAFGGSPNSVSNGSYLIPANETQWDQSYEFIRSTNYLLMKAEESGLGAEIDRWVGEALFFRAYNYWYLEGGIWQTTYPGFVGTNATHTGYMLRKFLGEDLNSTQFRGEYDYKEFRYGEVLLILAEALYEKNGSISNTDLERTINEVRSRVGMPGLTNDFATANGLDMREEIRRERTVELAFEGFRREDLRRWKIAETVLPESLRGVKFVGTEFQSRYPEVKPGTDIKVDADGFIIADQASARKFDNPKHYLDPIPSQQVQLSKGTLEQNEGWK